MDNNGKIYTLLDQASFNDWLTQFFNKKSNELAYSRQNQPKRMEKLVLNLATANTEGYKVPVPFKSCVVSRIYSTSSGTDKAGSIKILFDQPNLGNLNNAVNLFVNDTLKSEVLFTESYLLWSAQADTTMELYFFPDLEISTGTTKTQIVGTVSTSNGILNPSSTNAFRYSGTTGTNIYTCASGTYAIVKVQAAIWNATQAADMQVNSVSVFYAGNATPMAVSQYYVLKAGDVINSASTSGSGSSLSIWIETYTII